MKKENTFKSIEAERFINEVQRVVDAKKASSFAEVARSTGYVSQDFTDIKSGKKDLQRKFLDAVASVYDINKSFVLTGTHEQMATSINVNGRGEIPAKPNPRLEASPSHLAADPLDFDNNGSKFEELADGTILMRVRVIPHRAFAGYLRGFQDPEYYEDMEYVSFEVYKQHRGHYLAFEVHGDSMTTLEPELFRKSIFDGVKVVGRELPRTQWKYKLHTHHWNAWIIVHKTEGILIKQIIAHDVDNGIITIHSLNPNKKEYPDQDLFLDDIEQIFNVVKKLDD